MRTVVIDGLVLVVVVGTGGSNPSEANNGDFGMDKIVAGLEEL